MARPPGGRGRLLFAVLVVAFLASATAAMVVGPAGDHAPVATATMAAGPSGGQSPIATAAVETAAVETAAVADPTHATFPVAQPTQSEATPPATDDTGSVRLMVVGDVMLARSIGAAAEQSGPGVVFAGVADQLALADILAVNLECTIATTGTPEHKHYKLRAPPVTADALAMVGVDVAGQANNHSLDYGPDALAETRSLLADRGISVAGAGPDRASAHAPVIIERNGLRIAFLAYVAAFSEVHGFNTKSWAAGPTTPGIAIARPSVIRANVTAALQDADLVVVLMHAGYEGFSTPSGLERRLDRAALDAGATLVVGAHPHVLQGYRLRGNHLIAYGMGNFVFDMTSGTGADSAILDVTLTRDGVSNLHWIPVRLNNGFPVLAYGADARRILAQLRPI